MDKVRTSRLLTAFLMIPVLGVILSACETLTASKTAVSGSSSSTRFASGTKGVKIITSDTTLVGSFGVPASVPVATPAPATFPGAGVSYKPGVSPTRYFDLDGTTSITQPSWLLDFQLGITSITGNSGCSTFGTSVENYFRVSEKDCSTAGANDGVGGSVTDSVFARIILNRDTAVIGSGENLLIQVEYQASGIHLNSDGTQVLAENNLDQLWKVFWSTAVGAATGTPFAVFIPPNYSACIPGGSSNTNAGTASDLCHAASNPTYKGAPTKVRQFIIPLSAYPTMSVIQLSRVKGRISANGGVNGGDNYVADFCATDSPLCLGVVIRSVTIMRM